MKKYNKSLKKESKMISLEEIIIEKILSEKEIQDIARKKVIEALEDVSCDEITRTFTKSFNDAFQYVLEDNDVIYDSIQEVIGELAPLIMKRVVYETKKVLDVE